MDVVLKILFYLVVIFFGFMGLGALTGAARSHIGFYIGSFCYLWGAIGALAYQSWWPLLAAYVLALLVRRIFGSPS